MAPQSSNCELKSFFSLSPGRVSELVMCQWKKTWRMQHHNLFNLSLNLLSGMHFIVLALYCSPYLPTAEGEIIHRKQLTSTLKNKVEN